MRTIRSLLYTAITLAASTAALANGDIDPAWDGPNGGYTVTQIGAGDAVPNAIGIDSTGRVVLAGYSYPTAQGTPQFTAVRYLGDNSVDVGHEDPGATACRRRVNNLFSVRRERGRRIHRRALVVKP